MNVGLPELRRALDPAAMGGWPVAFSLTPGNVADITMAVLLLSAVEPPKRLIADKAYGIASTLASLANFVE